MKSLKELKKELQGIAISELSDLTTHDKKITFHGDGLHIEARAIERDLVSATDYEEVYQIAGNYYEGYELLSMERHSGVLPGCFWTEWNGGLKDFEDVEEGDDFSL